MKNNKNIIMKVKAWVDYADEDLRTAKIALSVSSNIPYRVIAFHSQQSSEKYIKALLVLHSIDFPYTHNISTLIELLEPVIDLNKELKAAKGLSKYAVAVRYPVEYMKIKKSDASRTVKIAEYVRQIISDILKEEGIKIKSKHF